MSSDSTPDEHDGSNKYRKQKFCLSWLKDDNFKGWLQPINTDEFKCKCKACDIVLNCGESDLQKHAATKQHKENVSSINSSTNSFFAKQANGNEVVRFEIRMSLFFAEHNVAIQIIDHLIPLLKEIVTDSDIIKNCHLGRTKCTKIIRNVLASEEKQQLVQILKISKFSVLIDESTDIGSHKIMCVLVRYFDEKQEKINVQLLDLLQLGPDCTAESLYNHFKTCIIGYDIPYENIIGLCCDGASVMVGQHNSFASKLLADNPDIITIKCICHTAAIIANKSCLTLPRTPEDLIRQIGTYISGSSKRCSELGEFQELLNIEKRKILRTSTTRWLSHQKCVERILENWNVLIKYFKHAVVQDKLKSAELILNELTNECNKAYLLFLKYVLNYFNSLNALFQSKKTLVHVLHSESLKLFFKLGQNFIKKSELKFNCNVRSPHVRLQIDEIYVGSECEELLKTFPKKNSYQIKSDCLQFYITALEETQKRLPLKSDTIFKEIEFLNPEVALGSINKNVFQFKILCQKFKIDINLLTDEWLTMEYYFSEPDKKNFCKLDMAQFWSAICKPRSYKDKLIFPNFSKLVKILLALPHANADAEKIFSIVTDVRTKKRNKLSHIVLNSICIIRSHLQSNTLNCISFKCTAGHFKKMNSKELYN